MAFYSSLRKSFLLLGAGLSCLIILLATVLVISVNSMTTLSNEIRLTLGLDRAAMGIQTTTFRATRSNELYGETGDLRWKRDSQEAEEALVSWLDLARGLPKPPNVEESFSHLEATIEELRREVLGAPPDQRSFRLIDLMEAEAAAYAFMQSIVESAEFEVVRADRWGRIANLLAATSIIAVVLCLAFVGVFVRKGIYLPILRLRRALELQANDPEARVPETGAKEFRAIGAEVNVLIGRLAAQREQEVTFMAGIAHDLRNPMAALRTAAQLVERRSENEDQRQRAGLVLRQVDRMNRLVEDLLDRSRIEAGQFELHLESNDLRGLVRDTCALYGDVSKTHEICCAVPDEPVPARFDSTRISQILGNLVGNAIKYSPDGGPVDVRLGVRGDWAIVEVTDVGLGISDSEQSTVFDPFSRSPGVKESIPGVGLGLSVARRLARAHGGEIELESTVGVGSTFRVRLPLDKG